MVAGGHVAFRLDAQGLIKAMRKSEVGIYNESLRALRRSHRRLDREMQRTRLRAPGLNRRTGRLAQSFTGEVAGATIGSLVMRYGTNVPYAKIHEYGGTVRPKKGRYLTIPLKANLTAAGVMKRGIREFPVVRFIRLRGGDRLLALAGDDPDNLLGLQPMFVLVRQVKIPARLGLRRTWIIERRKLTVDLNAGIRRVLAAQ